MGSTNTESTSPSFSNFLWSFCFLVFFAGLVIFWGHGLFDGFHGPKNESPAKENFWNGVSEPNMKVKVITNTFSEKNTLRKEEMLENIQWGKMELYPTIGSTPTFVYLDGYMRIHRIPCSDVKKL